jgi:hypothetical protein
LCNPDSEHPHVLQNSGELFFRYSECFDADEASPHGLIHAFTAPQGIPHKGCNLDRIQGEPDFSKKL